MKLARHAFTLVELLVVIAIIGILIGMMFPAIGAMREASRRATCQGRMARIGLALQKREAAFGSLPAGTTDPKGPIHNVPQGIQIGWMVHLLLYIDEGNAFKQLDLAAGTYAEKNDLVRKLHISAFVCPTQIPIPTIAAPASSYAGCHHDVETPIAENNNGVLFLNSHISERDVSDGVEHTIYVGEKKVDEGDLGWMAGNRATLRNAGTPIDQTPTDTKVSRWVQKKPEEEPEEKADANEQAPSWPGAPTPPPEHYDEIASKFPPNDLYVGGFGSHHPSGAGFLFGDRAVKFLNVDIDKGILQQLANRADGKLLDRGPTRE